MPIAAADERSAESGESDVPLTTPGPADEIEGDEPEGPAAPIVDEPLLSESVVDEPLLSDSVGAEEDPGSAIDSADGDSQLESGTAAAGEDAAPGQDDVAESGAADATGDEPSRSGAPAAAAVAGSQPTGATGTDEIAVSAGAPDEGSEVALGPVPGGAAPAQVGADLLEGVAGTTDVGPALGLPLALLVGVVLFLILESRTGSHAPKLSEAPRRSRGTARFSDIGE